VVAVDVPEQAVSVGSPARSAVTVSVPIGVQQVVSVHVDDADAEPDVRAAALAVDAADAGDDDARLVVDGAAGNELLWYDVTELDDVLGR
jgi:hypothetical protein